jgi:hypothetical protein
MQFEWDPAKNERNIAKHDVGFGFVTRVFDGRLIQWRDTRVEYGEERWNGLADINGRVYFVAWTMRGPDTVRLISARKANERETIQFKAQAAATTP